MGRKGKQKTVSNFWKTLFVSYYFTILFINYKHEIISKFYFIFGIIFLPVIMSIRRFILNLQITKTACFHFIGVSGIKTGSCKSFFEFHKRDLLRYQFTKLENNYEETIPLRHYENYLLFIILINDWSFFSFYTILTYTHKMKNIRKLRIGNFMGNTEGKNQW